jgi:Type I phosphodiesterase / nucleotide pyrophosphatase
MNLLPLEIAAIAEEKLLERQKLPEFFGVEKVRPSYDGLGLANIAALATEWLCPEANNWRLQPALPGFNPSLLDSPIITDAWNRWLNLAPINHVVLLIVDAFGYDQLQTVMTSGDIPGLAATLKSDKSFFMPATSIFPSTTVAALTSAATAYGPSHHGVMATTVYLRTIGSVANLLRWRPSLSSNQYTDSQLNPDAFLPVPNLYMLLEKAGIYVEIINHHSLHKSGLTRFTTAGSKVCQNNFHGYLTPSDGCAILRDRLKLKSDDKKSFTSIYIPNIDTSAHCYGPASNYYRSEIAALDFSLKRELLEPLTGCSDIVLLITADHGQRFTNPDKILNLSDHPQLTDLLFAPSTGGALGRYLHLIHGKEAEAINYIQQNFADEFLVITQAEAIELGLFGLPNQPLGKEASNRVGDLILIPRQDWISLQNLGEPTTEKQLPKPGIHGGLSRAEMLIPFIGCRL